MIETDLSANPATDSKISPLLPSVLMSRHYLKWQTMKNIICVGRSKTFSIDKAFRVSMIAHSTIFLVHQLFLIPNGYRADGVQCLKRAVHLCVCLSVVRWGIRNKAGH